MFRRIAPVIAVILVTVLALAAITFVSIGMFSDDDAVRAISLSTIWVLCLGAFALVIGVLGSKRRESDK